MWTFPLFFPLLKPDGFWNLRLCCQMTLGAKRHGSWARQPPWCRGGCDVSSTQLLSLVDVGSAKVWKHRSLYRGRIFQFCVKACDLISEITSNACLIHIKNILLKNSIKSTSSLIGHHLPNNSCTRLAQLHTNNPHNTVSECHLICWQADRSKQADYRPIVIFSWNIGSECRMRLFWANPQTAFTSPNPCGSLFFHSTPKTKRLQLSVMQNKSPNM